MSKYINADKLKKLIDEKYREFRLKGFKEDSVWYHYADGLDFAKQLIDSLQAEQLKQEQPEVDLEEEIEEWFDMLGDAWENGEWSTNDIKTTARHFYELAESEDERIRKNILALVKEHAVNHERCQMEAYLEKQKDEAQRQFDLGVQAGREEALYDIEKQKEQNGEDKEDITIYHPVKNGKGEYECIPYSFYGSLTSFSEDKDLIDFLRTCFYTEEECNEWIERQKEQKSTTKETELNSIAFLEQLGYTCIPPGAEQKPAEWSEKDETCLENALWCVIKTRHFVAKDACDLDACRCAEKWLNSLPERFNLSPKQELGEEDKKFIDKLCNLFPAIAKNNYVGGYYVPDLINRLKSLRPQPHWKPSGKQMEALNFTLAGANINHYKDALFSLRNELQKL